MVVDPERVILFVKLFSKLFNFAKVNDHLNQGGVMFCRHRLPSGKPLKKIVVRLGEKRLKAIKIFRSQFPKVAFRKAAQQQVIFLHAAVLAKKKEPFQARL